MLTQPAVAPYLLQRDLISAQSLVAGDLAVVDATRRNSNFKVISERGPSYLLKQGVGPDRSATVDYEAAVYRLLRSHRQLASIAPHVCHYDPQEHILALELLEDAQHMGEYHRRGRFSARLAGHLGRALGTLHRTTAEWGQANWHGLAGKDAPWVLTLQRPTMRLYHEISNANVQLVNTIQRFPEFGQMFDAMNGQWKRIALVHYDIKWENLLVTRRGRS